MGARKSGSVGKNGAVLREKPGASVPTLADSRAERGKKGLFSPKSGTVGTDAPGFPRNPKTHYRRSRIPA